MIKRLSDAVDQRLINNSKVIIKKTKGQTMNYKIPHCKLKIEQHEHPKKPGEGME